MAEEKKGFRNFMAAHENVAQIIKFTIFSLLAFAVEYISFTVIVLGLKKVNQDASFWIFRYTTANGGLGAMIAFFVSNVLAQITSFIINRKKTFKATNNIWFSAISYAIMVCGIIILNTWAGAAITAACNKSIQNLTLCQYIGKFSGSFMSFFIVFVMNKFVIMRKTDKKEVKPAVTPVRENSNSENK